MRYLKYHYLQGFRLKLLSINTFMWITSALYAPFLSAYYVENGLTTMEIGIIGAVTPVLTIVIQPIWAFISDYTNRRRLVLMIVVAGSAITVLGYLLCTNLESFLVVSLIFALFHAAMQPLCDALVTKVCAERDVNFAHIRLGGTIGYAITVLAISNLFKEDPRLSFPVASVAFFIMLLFVKLLPKDEGRRRREKAGGEAAKKSQAVQSEAAKKPQTVQSEAMRGEVIQEAQQRTAVGIGKETEVPDVTKAGKKPGFASGLVFRTKQVYLVLLLALIMNLGFAIYGYYTVFILNLGYDQSVIGLCSCISALSEIPVLMFAKKLFSRFGSINLLIFATLMLAGRILLVSTGILPLMVFAQLFQSVTYMTTYYGCVSYISEHCAEGKNSQAQSCLTMVQAGIGSVLGSLLGGFLTSHFTMQYAFLLTAVSLIGVGSITFFCYKLWENRKIGKIRKQSA